MRPVLTRALHFALPMPWLPSSMMLLAALGVRVLWLAYTGHTAEDAFITFRFARQISQGFGFTYNVGERIYGTTTPLLTLLLAAWDRIASGNDAVVTGAHALGLAASMSSLLLLDAVLHREQTPRSARLLVLGVFALSSKVLVLDLQGMEMPLVICLMMASWLAFSRGHPGWAGLLAGCLLLTRIDLVLWPAALVLVELRRSRRGAAALAATTTLTYLPWLVFASIYFGSPVPHTITAKQIAYGVSTTPIAGQFRVVLEYLSPLDLQLDTQVLALVAGAATVSLAAWQAARSRHSPAFIALSLFAGVEAAGLVLTRATFFARYLYPLLWAVLTLATLRVASLWPTASRHARRLAGIACVVFAGALIVQAGIAARRAQVAQEYRYEGSLRAMGQWLSTHGSEDDHVLLEPLGYVGYYSGLYMIDEVGLVSPDVVALKERGIPVEEYFAAFFPEFVIQHCDDAARFQRTQATSGIRFADAYAQAATFDPLGDSGVPAVRAAYPGLDRSACYIIWQRVGTEVWSSGLHRSVSPTSNLATARHAREAVQETPPGDARILPCPWLPPASNPAS
jgi:hypothetical protein